jgi:putative transposase
LRSKETEATKRSKFTEEQILFALKHADARQPVGHVCRQLGISEATFYVWKKRDGNLGLLEVRELRQLRDDNARLKRLVADLTMDRYILQEVAKQNLTVYRLRDIAQWIHDCVQLSVRRSCLLELTQARFNTNHKFK